MPDVVDLVWVKAHDPSISSQVHYFHIGLDQLEEMINGYEPYQADVVELQTTMIDLQTTVGQLISDLAALVAEHNAQGARLDVLDPP
jgi:hypothetical protein